MKPILNMAAIVSVVLHLFSPGTVPDWAGMVGIGWCIGETIGNTLRELGVGK